VPEDGDVEEANAEYANTVDVGDGRSRLRDEPLCSTRVLPSLCMSFWCDQGGSGTHEDWATTIVSVRVLGITETDEPDLAISQHLLSQLPASTYVWVESRVVVIVLVTAELSL
jgi:hypothetical protein